MLTIKETETGIIFAVRVLPRSSKCDLAGLQGDALKIKITAPPVEGRANEECIRFLADLLNVKKAQVAIVSGHTSKNKRVSVSGLTAGGLRTALRRNGLAAESGSLFQEEQDRSTGPE